MELLFENNISRKNINVNRETLNVSGSSVLA